MKISQKAKAQAKRLFRRCFRDGFLDEGRVRETVDQLIQQRPRDLLPILVAFYQYVRLEWQRHVARITSAVPLPKEEQDRILQILERRYGRLLGSQFEVDPAVIAGLRIQVGSEVIDGTVRGRLEELLEQL